MCERIRVAWPELGSDPLGALWRATAAAWRPLRPPGSPVSRLRRQPLTRARPTRIFPYFVHPALQLYGLMAYFISTLHRNQFGLLSRRFHGAQHSSRDAKERRRRCCACRTATSMMQNCCSTKTRHCPRMMLVTADANAPELERDEFGDFSVAPGPASLSPLATSVAVPAQVRVRGSIHNCSPAYSIYFHYVFRVEDEKTGKGGQ